MTEFDKVWVELNKLDMTITRKRTGTVSYEYRVNYRVGGSESSAYYTDDLNDARTTGLAMRNHLD
jgi:hypothetical protein